MNVTLFSIFMLIAGGILFPLLMFAPLLIKAPKNQPTLIFLAFNSAALMCAFAVLYKLFSGENFALPQQREIFFELVIYLIFCLMPLFIRSTRKRVSSGCFVISLTLFAVTSLLLTIPLLNEKAYLYLVTELTTLYIAIDPIRVLIPIIWCSYEATKKDRTHPNFLMSFIQNTLSIFILLLVAWLVYIEFYLLSPELIDQLGLIGYKDYGQLFPIKFFHIGIVSILIIILDAYWAQNYTLSAIDEHENQARIAKLLIEKDQLIQDLSNKNALVETGALSAGLAHELNQFLARIQMNSDEALAHINRPGTELEDLKPYLKNTLTANHSAANLIISLKKLFQAGKLESVSVDLDALVFDIASLYEDRARKSRIQIKLNLQANASFMVWDSLMRQAIANLIANAIDALDIVDRSNKEIQIQSSLDAYGRYCLEIADNGLGIDPAQAERLFSLFSSDKPSGTGIGLWLSSYIVQRHQGTLEFKNLPNREGVSFFITIAPA
ncbi:sensor histidine kinase [Polynucleobacter sp. UK-Kesae-W10]|uniref:sensor histidine kinase n=1 Tax=Polynucleobacter sp. UK-Kesae-W10 TaxID=1819738 RepID=UPI001C0B5C99|nr:HAMP domain-containing sensor histidine kinase [Polynucleobacter sp. UK-Kesae-W10]MBU3578131.1 HAMP domain-containing histidine kinase [Polynucleobacter sp. UK-Kesae-W10]